MNPAVAKAIDFTLAELKEYLFGRGPGCSDYLRGRDFAPGALSRSAPTQLHDVERHENGAGYIHLSQGNPDLKREWIAYLDGIPRSLVQSAIDNLRRYNQREWRALDDWIHRTSDQTAKQIAEGKDIARCTQFVWRDQGLAIIFDRLQWEIEKACEEKRNKDI